MNLSKIERMVREGDLSLDALKYLIDCRGECEWLDFKQALHLDNDYGVATFTRDALAMKNTGGGYLVIGVQDRTWVPVGLTEELPYDAKLIRDKIRRGSGLDLQVDIVQHQLRYTGEPRWFAVVLVRAALKRRKRRTPFPRTAGLPPQGVVRAEPWRDLLPQGRLHSQDHERR